LPYRENSEVPGLWRADNVATPLQIQDVSEQLITPEYIIAEAPLIYALPGTNDYSFRTLSVISNCVVGHKRDPLSLMSAAIQEQTHLLLSQAWKRNEPFYARRTVFEIGLAVEQRPEGKIPADTLYLKLAHYDTTPLRQLENEVGERVLDYIRGLRDGRLDLTNAEEARTAIRGARKSFFHHLHALQVRAAYGEAAFDEAEMLLSALRQRGEPLMGCLRSQAK
jgi:hypothetical protein